MCKIKIILLITLSIALASYTSLAQDSINNKDAVLTNSDFYTSTIQQYGSDNKVLFMHQRDPQLNLNAFNSLKIFQAGDKNNLILLDVNQDARLDIGQSGNNNRLIIEDVNVPMQIRQKGGMEITIRGSNFLHTVH